MNNHNLTSKEEVLLVELLKKVNFPVSLNLFRAIVETFISVSIELAVFDENGRIFLTYRNDEYEGYHIPGTFLRNEESPTKAMNRLIETEFKGVKVKEPVDIGWWEYERGHEYNQDPNRHTISLLYACQLAEPYLGAVGKFFPITNLPDNILGPQKLLIPEIVKRFNLKN